MSQLRRLSPLVLFLLGYAILAVIGTRTKMVFQWPSYMLIGLAAIVTLFSIRRQLKVRPGTWCLVSMLALTGYVVGRGLSAPVSYFARVEITMALAAALTYVIFSVYLVRSRYRLAFVGLLFVLSSGNVIIGLYQVIRDSSFMLMPGYSRLRPEAAGGFYDNHNHLGGFLLVVVSFALALMLFGRMGPKMRVTVIFVSGLSMFGIAISASRGALLSFAFLLLAMVLLGLFLAKRLYEYEFKKIVSVAVVLCVIGLVPVSIVGWKALEKRSSVRTEAAETIDGLTEGRDVRFTNWSLALDQWKDHPIVGQGPRMYDIYSVQYWPGSMNWVHGDPEFAHNDYLQMLGEYGLLGIALMLFFIVTHVGAGIRYVFWYREKAAPDRGRTYNALALCLGALLVLAGYAIHSIFDFNLHLPANLIPVAFAFAILSNPEPRSTGRRSAPQWLVLSTRLALPACGLYLVVAGFFYSRSEWHVEQARRVDISEYSEVISHLDKAFEYDKKNFESYQLHGSALMSFGFDFDIEVLRAGFMERASRSFERALELNPYDLFSMVGLARCLDETGEYERAEELFKRATEIGPWRREPHLRYGYHLLNRGVDLIAENLAAGIELLENGKAEIEMSRKSNERPLYNLRDDPDMLTARRYLSLAYEEHGNRLVDAGKTFGDDGDTPKEIAFLNSARDYYRRAIQQATGRTRATQVRLSLDATEKRLKELGVSDSK